MKHKTLGQVYTPEWIVKEILKEIDFEGKKIFSKKIIDPACGDGAFLKEIVKKILKESIKNNKSIEDIKNILQNNIYGIEIDTEEYLKCIKNLNQIIENQLNINLNINWNIYNDNTLIKYKEFINYFDYVVGNPPYIRIHNLDTTTRKILKENFIFNQGTIDIYLSFFELGFKLLNKNGILGYITPNSFLRNSSYKNFRQYLKENKVIQTLIDFKSNKIFKNFSTYTAITIINFSEKEEYFNYKELDNNLIKEVNKIEFNKLDNKSWSFSSKKDMDFLKELYENSYNKVSDFFDVQYGFATLRDKIFISKIEKEKDSLVLFNNYWIEKSILKKIVKGSTYKGKKSEIKYIIFPYKKLNSKFIPIDENELKNNFPYAYNYLLDNKEELLKRNIDKNINWYEFGRSQGIQSSCNEKIVVSPLIKDKIHYNLLEKDIFVYSGLFIIKKEEKTNWNLITNILNSDKFKKYVEIKGKDFSGGYKSITSKLIKDFPINTPINKYNNLFDYTYYETI
jgi:adenine-specific DNA-methyltransferase